ncbi:hypothetical protein L686_22670 [Stutzerimonas stutzeri MF28]|jgi:hypothetical protein|nr:hypothetical protein L686_22670 [Stutzerimonas stutzeri MF28]
MRIEASPFGAGPQEALLMLLSAVVAFAVAGVAAVPFQVPAWAVGMVMEVPD